MALDPLEGEEAIADDLDHERLGIVRRGDDPAVVLFDGHIGYSGAFWPLRGDQLS